MIELLDFNIEKILMIFSISPGSRINRTTIKEKTNIPNVILDKCLAKLLNFNILIKEKNLFYLNFKNSELMSIIKKLSEKHFKFKQLPLREYFIIQEIVYSLSELKGIENVYLFGSYSKLIFHENSDIDIAIVSNTANEKEINKVTRKLEKKYKKTIETHVFSKDFYKNKRDPLVKEIIQHGIKAV